MSEVIPQIEFLKYLRFERGLLACDEVTNYGCIADILVIDRYKKHIIEYEFKNNSQDLKFAEQKKSKYLQQYKYFKGHSVKTECSQPHRFYFVVPEDLWEKEKCYLESRECGVIMYFYDRPDRIRFVTMKTCKIRDKNLQKYDIAAKNILIRCTSAYVNLLAQYNRGRLP